MELKGISTLEWWLTKWLKNHGFPDVKARAAADFQYDNYEETIYFALAVPDEHDKKFIKFCQDHFSFPYDCDNFILSFFHELGHYVTWDDWDDDAWIRYFDSKDNLIANDAPIEDYFALPIEFWATCWGCVYIKSHAQEIEEFWRVCQKLIMNIYNINRVEVD